MTYRGTTILANRPEKDSSMNRLAYPLLTLALWLAPVPSLGEEPSTQPLRAWTDSTGKYTIRAEFVELKSGKVRLRKLDGKEVTIPIEKLSDEDRELLRQQSQGKPASEPAPKELAVDLPGGKKLELVLIPAGSFMMGDEKGERTGRPVHKVTLTRPFYLGKYMVTQEQWQAVMGSDPSHFKGAQNPVDYVLWDDCQKFLEKLNAKVGKNDGKFALPTEAQWEHACRAGSTTKYYFGDDNARLGDYAWFVVNSKGKPHPVGEKKPNAWGLYDMHGNVWEWCQDWYRRSTARKR